MLQHLFEEPHAGAVGAFEEDGATGGRRLPQACFGGFDVGEPLDFVILWFSADKLEFFAHEDGLDGGVGKAVGDGLMFVGAFDSQFAHAAEDGHLVGHGQGFEVVERHLHARGIGVVAVEEERVAGGLFVLRAFVRGLVLLDGLLDVPRLHAEMQPHGHGGHAVVKVIVAQQVGADIVDVVANLEVEVHIGVTAHKGAACVGGAAAVGDGFQATLGSLCGEDVVVCIDKGSALFGREVAVKFCFSLDDPFEAAKTFEMGAAHVGDKAEVGVGDATEVGNLARMTGPHLDDGNLCVGGDGEEREGHTEVVVKIAGGGVGAVAFGQDGVDKLLGGGLAVGAGDAEEGDGELAAVVSGQLLQGGEHVWHHDASVVDFVLRVADNAKSGTLFESLGREGIAVEGLALEGEEEAAGGNTPRVGSDRAGLQIGMI